MPTITFNGAAKTITIGYDAATTLVEATDIYSRWKDWVAAGNAQYLPAFSESVGGNEIGGGTKLGKYIFIRNDLGWRVVPANQAHTLQIGGEFYPSDAGQAFVTPPTADVLVVFQRSAFTTLSETGVSGLTSEEAQNLALVVKLLRNKRITDPDAGTQTIFDDDNSTVLLDGALWEDADGTIPYRGQGAERADRLT